MVILYKLTQLLKCLVKNLTTLLFIIFVCIILYFTIRQDVTKYEDVILFPLENRPKYVLIWDPNYLLASEKQFSELNCSVQNCVFTKNTHLFSDYSQFDAIIFNHAHLNTKEGRPNRRSNSQIYIFNSIESPVNMPACELFNDDFFNWTFTYKLDSDVVWSYFVVRNVTGNIVAPSSQDVKWVSLKNVVSPKIRSILKGRTRAAAWLVSHCEVNSLRNEYLTRLQEHLFHYSLTLDVFGLCTKTDCENKNCEKMLKNHYYFYMAFENSFSEDYATEKVLHGYDNYVVPIVYGGANYSRFLPPGSYINARDYHPYNLAKIIYNAINNHTVYEAYFNWTNFYTIKSPLNSIDHPLCKLCEALNSERAGYAPVKKNFRFWWNKVEKNLKWCLSLDYWNEMRKLNIDGNYMYNTML